MLFRRWEGCIVGAPIPGPGVQVRPMPVAGCSGTARRGTGFTPLPAWGMRSLLESISAVPGAGGAPLRCQECAPHFLLSCQKKTCRARYKRKPPFIGLLVRPVETGLGSSSCAGPLALPVRSRRICVAYAKSLVQIGLLCATAPLPLSRQKKRVYAPAGKKLATNAQPSGSGARGTTGPLCTLRFVPNVTNAAQASWELRTMSTAGNSQAGYHPMFS